MDDTGIESATKVTASSTQVAITEAAIRESFGGITDITTDGLQAIEIRPIGSGNPDAALNTGVHVELHKPVSKDNPDYFFVAAFEARSQGRFAAANDILTAGLARHTTNFRLMFNRGYVLLRLGKYSGALKDYITALQDLQAHAAVLSGRIHSTHSIQPVNPHERSTFTYDYLEPEEALALITARLCASVDEGRGLDTVPSPRRPQSANPLTSRIHNTFHTTRGVAPIRVRARDAAADAKKMTAGSLRKMWRAKVAPASLGDDPSNALSALQTARIAQIATRFNAAVACLHLLAAKASDTKDTTAFNDSNANANDIPLQWQDPVLHLTEALALVLPAEAAKRAALHHARAAAHRTVGDFLHSVQDYVESRRQALFNFAAYYRPKDRTEDLVKLLEVAEEGTAFDPSVIPAAISIHTLCQIPDPPTNATIKLTALHHTALPKGVPNDFACAAGYKDCFFAEGPIFSPPDFRPSETALSASMLKQKCLELIRPDTRTETSSTPSAATDHHDGDIKRLEGYGDLLVLQSATGRSELINRDPIAFVMHVTRDSRLLSSLPTYAHAAIARCMTFRQFEEGDIIYRQGDAADYYYAIVEGSVNVHLDRQAPTVRSEFKMASALKLGRKWLAKARAHIPARSTQARALSTPTPPLSPSSGSESEDVLPAPIRPVCRSISQEGSASPAKRRLSARLIKAQDERVVRMSFSGGSPFSTPATSSPIRTYTRGVDTPIPELSLPSPAASIRASRTAVKHDHADAGPPLSSDGWTGEGVKLKVRRRRREMLTATVSDTKNRSDDAVPRSIVVMAGHKAPPETAAAELAMGMLLGTLHVGEAFGERAMHAAWSLELEHERAMHQTEGITLAAKPKRTRDQPGMWREVSVVAAEAATLLCLHKEDFVHVMKQLHEHMDAEIASFLLKIPLLRCCTAAEVTLLARHASLRRFVSGGTVVVQGQRFEGLYILRSGRCRIETQQQITVTKQVVVPVRAVPTYPDSIPPEACGSPRLPSKVSVPSLKLPGKDASGLRFGQKRVVVAPRRPSIIEMEGNRQYLSSMGVDVSRTLFVGGRFNRPQSAAPGATLHTHRTARTEHSASDGASTYAPVTLAAPPSAVADDMIRQRRRLSVTTGTMLRRASLAGAIDMDFKVAPTAEMLTVKEPAKTTSTDYSNPRFRTVTQTTKRKIQLGTLGLYDYFGEAQVLSVPQEITKEPLSDSHAEPALTKTALSARPTSPRGLRFKDGQCQHTLRVTSEKAEWHDFENRCILEGSASPGDLGSGVHDIDGQLTGRYSSSALNRGRCDSMDTTSGARVRGAPVRLSAPATIICDSHVEMVIISRDALFQCTSFASRQAMREYLIKTATREGAAEAAHSYAQERSRGHSPTARANRRDVPLPAAKASSTTMAPSDKLMWDTFRKSVVNEVLLTSRSVQKAVHESRGSIVSVRGRKYKYQQNAGSGALEMVNKI